MENQNKKNVKLGIFIFVGLLFFVIGVLAIGNINSAFTKSILVSTSFHEVNGLQPGDNVWLSGVKVGTVKEMTFQPNSDVLVIIKLEAKLQQYIPQDAFAKISSDGLIGNKLIIIYGGDIHKGYIQENDQLAIQDTYTNEDMMNTLQENNKNVLVITENFKTLSNQLVKGEGSIGKLLSDDELYTKLNASIATLNNASQKIVTLTSSLATYAEKLNTTGNLANDIVTDTLIFNELTQAVDNLNTVSKTAIDIANNLQTTTASINTNTTSPAGIILHDTAVANSLKQSIYNLESSSAKLNENMEALQHNFLFRRYFKNK